MSQEELLLQCWRDLPPAGKTKVLEFTQFLQDQGPDLDDSDFGAPEHLQVRSQAQLDQLLQEGIESLDRGEGIEATDSWWEKVSFGLGVSFGVIVGDRASLLGHTIARVRPGIGRL